MTDDDKNCPPKRSTEWAERVPDRGPEGFAPALCEGINPKFSLFLRERRKESELPVTPGEGETWEKGEF